MKQKVVIIGHGYTSRLGIIRSLAELDCEITVIALVTQSAIGRMLHLEGIVPIDYYSKYVHKVYFCYAKDEKGLLNVLIKKCSDPNQKVIIIPDSDFSAVVIDDNQNLLKEKNFLFPHIGFKAGEVKFWMDKTRQKQLATSVGLNVAGGTTISVKGRHYTMPENVKFPCFTKPLSTINGGKQFFKRCDNASQLQQVLDAISQKFDTEVLIEDYKTIDIEYALVGFSDGNQVVIPGIIEFITNSPSHFGIAREGKIMPVIGFEELLEQFKVFVRRIGFCGLFDIDFYKSGGSIYFGEMNLRFGGSGYAYTAMGANLPAMMVKHMQGEDWTNMPHCVAETATYVNERIAIDDFGFNHISKADYYRVIKNARIHFVFNQKDPHPQRAFRRYFWLQCFKRKLRAWKGHSTSIVQ